MFLRLGVVIVPDLQKQTQKDKQYEETKKWFKWKNMTKFQKNN